jgi:Leucine-rich repeat (LRR) protein
MKRTTDDATSGPEAKKLAIPCALKPFARTLVELKIQRAEMAELPAAILEFTCLQKLDLAFNNLTTLPTLPTSLKVMFFLENKFESLPASLVNLSNLTMLSFKVSVSEVIA